MSAAPDDPAARQASGRTIAASVAAALLVAGAAFAVGRFTAFDATTAPPTPGTSSAEAGFARDMQTHHAQAVDMAMTIHAKTTSDDVRLLSYDIATSQQAQIGTMSEWLISWGLPALGDTTMGWMTDGEAHAGHGGTGSASTPTSVEEMHAAMGMATTAELADLDAATGTAADCLFLELMIRHHDGAIEMVDAVRDRASDARVLDLAAQMAAAQTAEIDVMRHLQTRLGCS